MRRPRPGVRGQALTEMALISPVLLLLGLLLVGGAQLFSAEIGLANAARAGANAAALAVSQGDASSAASAAAQAAQDEEGSLSCSSGSCVALTSTTGADSGMTIYTVTVDSTISPYIPLVPPITIRATAGATCIGPSCSS